MEDCAVDIILNVNFKRHRIPAQAYRTQELHLLTKTSAEGSDTSYSVGCKTQSGIVPVTYLRVKKSCTSESCFRGGKGWTEEEKRPFWLDRSRRAIAKEDRFGIVKIEFNDEFVLANLRGKWLSTDVTFEPKRFKTCASMPDGGCYLGCCGEGLMCVEGAEDIGRCVPRIYSYIDVCKASENESCRGLVTQWENLERWALVVASSGGGGHIAAARNLVAQWSKGWEEKARSFRNHFERLSETLLTAKAQKEMAAALKHAETRGPPIQQLDIMYTPCFDILGIHTGDYARRQWDNAQLAGDLDKLRSLIDQQWLTPWVFGKQCRRYFTKVLLGEELPFHGSPIEVISTQPLLLHSISRAMHKVEEERLKQLTLDVYMTDLPTEASRHFFAQLKKGVSWNKQASSHIRLHSVAPVDPNPRAKLAFLAGLPEDRIVIEDFMPVAMEFTEEDGMPKPGTEAKLTLKAQISEESAFLSDLIRESVEIGARATITVGEEDRMLLVMLGSQPTVQAMHQYLETALHVPTASGLNWIFLACGKPGIPDYAELYKAAAGAAMVFNAGARAEGRHLRIVPFTGQPAQQLLSRADATLTRSGGLTSGELLALAHRGDRKDVLVHVEVPEGMEALPPSPRKEEAQAWESEVLEGGMVGWEAGNARHLMEAIHARIVTSAMDFSKLLSFP